MHDIPSNAWIVLFCLVGFIVALNAGLILSLRRKSPQNKESSERIKQVSKNLRAPWEKEDLQLNELSKRAQRLRDDKKDESNKLPPLS